MDDNKFVESLRVGNEGISSELRSEIIAILTGEKTIKEVCDSHREDKNFPKDPKGIKRKMAELVKQDEEAKSLYDQYTAKKSNRPRGYDYVPEIIYMLKNDLSQRKVAEKYGIPRETIKTAIARVSDEKLIELIKRHSDRHALGRNCPSITLEEERNILAYEKEYLTQKAKETRAKEENNEQKEPDRRE